MEFRGEPAVGKKKRNPPAFIVQRAEGFCFPEFWCKAAGRVRRMGGGACGWRFRVRAGSEKQVCYCNKAYEEVKRRAVCRSHARLHDSQKRPEHELCGAPPPHLLHNPAVSLHYGTRKAISNHICDLLHQSVHL